MLQNAFSIQPFEAKRVRFESTRPFDEVLLNLRKLVGTAIPQKVNKQESGGGTREHFEILGETYLTAMQEWGGISREHFILKKPSNLKWEKAASCSSTR